MVPVVEKLVLDVAVVVNHVPTRAMVDVGKDVGVTVVVHALITELPHLQPVCNKYQNGA